MVAFTKSFLGFGKSASRSGAAKNAAQDVGHTLGGEAKATARQTRQRFSNDMTAYDLKTNSLEGMGVSTVRQLDGLSNQLFAADMKFQIAGAVAPGAVGLAAAGVGKLGMKRTESVLSTGQQWVAKPFEYLQKTPMGETLVGSKFADGVGAAASVPTRLMSWADGKTGLLTGRAGTLAQKSIEHGGKADALLTQLGGMNLGYDARQSLNALTHGHMVDGPDVRMLANDAITAAKGHSGEAKKLVKQVNKHLGKQTALLEKSQNWHGMAQGISHVRENVAATSLHQGAINTAFGITAATSAAVTAHDAISDMRAFRDMVADIKGKDAAHVGVTELIMGRLPPVAQAARAHIIKTAGPRMLFEAINAVFTVKSMKGQSSGLLNNIGFMVVPMLSQAYGSMVGSDILDTYKVMKTNEKNGVANDAALYAALILSSSEDLKKHATGGQQGSAFAQALGERYAGQGMGVKETLAAVTSGQVMQDIEQIIKENEALAKQQAAAANAQTKTQAAAQSHSGADVGAGGQPLAQNAPPQAAQPSAQSHVEKLNQPTKPAFRRGAAEQQPMGRFSKNVIKGQQSRPDLGLGAV